jgi:hypothetical protein
MARRVALARAIAIDPLLAMYDEPFAGLDPISINVIAKLIRVLNDELGTTSIIVSYDVQESLKVADHIFVIGDGKLVGEGTPDEMMASDEAGRPDQLPLPESRVRCRSGPVGAWRRRGRARRLPADMAGNPAAGNHTTQRVFPPTARAVPRSEWRAASRIDFPGTQGSIGPSPSSAPGDSHASP